MTAPTPETCTTHKNCLFVLSALLIALGFGFAGWAVQKGLATFRMEDRSVSVKGLAERNVEADLAIWTLSYSATGNELSAVQEQQEKYLEAIKTYAEGAGFSKDEIETLPLQSQDLMAQAYRPENIEQGRYIITQNINLRTTDMGKMDRAVAGIGGLLKQGVTLSNTQPPVYMYTKLNDIKPEMLAEAVKNARTSAGEFARDSGQSIGQIKSASQGTFQILPRDPVMYVSEQNQRYKTIRVVSTIDFYIR